MAADIKRIIRGIVYFSFVAASSFALAAENNQITDDEIIEYLIKDASDKYRLMERSIEDCFQQRDATKVKVTPEKINKRFEEAGLTWKDAMSAVLYVGQRNDDICSYEARANMLYAATSLEKAMVALKKEVQFEIEGETYTLKDMLDMVLFPIPDSYRIAVKYERLPTDVKEYMEQSFGKEPFNHMELMEGISPNS